MKQEKYRVHYNHFDSQGSCTTGFKDIYALNEEEARQKFIELHKNAPGKYEPDKIEKK